MDELQITVEKNNASIVCVTETWFKEHMDIHSLALEGFCLERKDRINGRGGGVACYIRNAINYKRLVDMEDAELEVMWIKIMPEKMPRKCTCILLAVFSQMRDHIITCVDTVIRSHPECGVIITGDFNQLQDNFLRTHYRFVQVVKVVTRGQATLDKILTNMVEVYTSPVTISELGTSDHSMVLWEPKCNKSVDTGKLIYVTVRCMGPIEKETFAKALSAVKWEALYRLETCAEQYAYYQTIIDKLMQMCFPTKMVSRHTSDKPWIK